MFKKLFNSEIIRFGLVGVLNTLVGAGIMFLLYNVFGVSYWISSAANYIVGGILSFFLNKHFTFRNEEKSFLQFLKFAAVMIVCYLIAYGAAKPLCMKLLSSSPVKVQENVAMVVGMVFYTVLNFIGQKFIAFRKKNRE